MISRLAIVNRGEPAVRLVRAVREWNRERDRDVRVIALATAAERRAMFVRQSDETVLIAARPGGAANPYLDLDVLRDALVEARADAVWVGWGFVAERPEFAELCEELGITFIGPSAEVMRRLGDKIGSKLLAEEAGVPVAPWSGGPVTTVEEAIEHGRRIGYPLVVKATAGGGGRGIRFVDREDELAAAIESAQGEAARAFGDGTVFMEGLVGDARHVEVQIVADDAGQVWALGVRDCSVQRRRQKVLEESSSVALDEAAERELRESAVRLASRGRLPQRRHGRVPVPARHRPGRVPRGQHPAAGRAPGDRGDDRRRHRQAAAARGRGRTASTGRRRRRAATPSRPA